MILYRIRRKDSGKYFGGLAYPWNVRGHEIWNDKGAFYRDIDTITAWLKVLCGDWKNNKDKIWCRNHWSAKKMVRQLDKFDKRKLRRYEIIVNNVTIKGQKIIQASEILK